MEDLAVAGDALRKDLSEAAQDVKAEVVANIRNSFEHTKYATPRVQLAWGYSLEQSRVRHVNSVENGRQCGCACPACGEELISKQGRKLAWHFAHTSGKECRNAVSAATCRFLAQWLSDGNGLDLPSVEYRYGGKIHERPARTGMEFVAAEAREEPDTGTWDVIARATAADQSSDLRILIRTNPRAKLPTRDECEADGISTMIVDLGAVLAVALEIEPDLCTDERWMTAQVISEAPRYWIWSKAGERLRQAQIDARVGPLIAIVDEVASHDVIETSDALQLIEALGLSELITPKGDDARGAFIFGRAPRVWRADLFLDLVLKPAARAFPDMPRLPATALGWKQTGAACRRLGIVPSPLMQRIEFEDLLELQIARPEYVEPVKVIDHFLDELAAHGVLRKRPRDKFDRRQTARFDAGLWDIKGANHSIAPGLFEAIFAEILAREGLRDALLKGQPWALAR